MELGQRAVGPNGEEMFVSRVKGVNVMRPYNHTYYRPRENEPHYSGAIVLPDGKRGVIVDPQDPTRWRFPANAAEKKQAARAVKNFSERFAMSPEEHAAMRDQMIRAGTWKRGGRRGPASAPQPQQQHGNAHARVWGQHAPTQQQARQWAAEQTVRLQRYGQLLGQVDQSAIANRTPEQVLYILTYTGLIRMADFFYCTQVTEEFKHAVRKHQAKMHAPVPAAPKYAVGPDGKVMEMRQ